MYPKEFLYTTEHEWLQPEGEFAKVGITTFAQKELGDVVFIEVPLVGTVLEADEGAGTIESVKAVAEVYSPVGGEVVEVNPALVENPELVNTDPHGDGWLFKLRMSSPDELKNLMTVERYEAFLQEDDA